MWSESDNHGFADEADYLRSLKKDDRYDLTYPFEYIAGNRGDGDYDIGLATMLVHVEWSEAQIGYVVSYEVPDMHVIDASQGNGDTAEFFEHDVHRRLIADLDDLGVGYEVRTF
jgi:hypothetical protein